MRAILILALTTLLSIFIWAFSGSSPEIIKFIFRKKEEKTEPNNHSIVPSNPQNTILCEIETDINKIKNSISTDLPNEQKQTFLRYYEKYRNQLQEATTIYDTFESITASQIPIKSYETPLSSLLGQIERLKLQYLTQN